MMTTIIAVMIIDIIISIHTNIRLEIVDELLYADYLIDRLTMILTELNCLISFMHIPTNIYRHDCFLTILHQTDSCFD